MRISDWSSDVCSSDLLVGGMIARGYPKDFAERTFKQIEGFGSYGFPESHAASFAKIAYASCWVKHRHPDVFCAALLNAQPMGFYAPAQIVRDAQQHGVEVRSEEHTSELQSLMRISYAVFCLKKKKQ